MRTSGLILLAGMLALSSCVSISTPPPVNTTPVFVTATLLLTPVPYASPTPLVSPTATSPTLSVTAPANCKDSAVLLQDVTIADGTNVPRGSKFTKTWQFQNTGSCPWSGYSIAFVSGDRMSAPDSAPISNTASKSNVNISVDLVAPMADGTYTGYFELRNPNGSAVDIGIEKTFWVKITVGTVLTPTAAPPTTPSPGDTPASHPTGPLSCKYVISGYYPNQIADLINSARTKAGLSALTIDSQLTAAAQGHSIDMACFSLLSHTGSDTSSPASRVAAVGYSGVFRDEIIYAGGYPQDAINWWMSDQVHHDAILDSSATEFGVGYAYVSDSAYGGYFTVDFGSR
jgi:uncharacterized protein YkwD